MQKCASQRRLAVAIALFTPSSSPPRHANVPVAYQAIVADPFA
jgi:hypothetical protein